MKPVLNHSKKLLTAVKDFFFPPYCTCCDTVTKNKSLICSTCYQIILASINVQQLDKNNIKTISLLPFSNTLKSVIHTLKYYNNPTPAQTILKATLSRESILQGIPFDHIEPVPLHWRRRIRRGYNQSQFLAQTVSEVLQIPISSFLKRKKYTLSQTGKSKAKRLKSMKNAFVIKRSVSDLQGKSILLIDDVLTTGATSEACAQVLIDAGVASVTLLTLSYVETT